MVTWGIENNLYLALDIILEEDKALKKKIMQP